MSQPCIYHVAITAAFKNFFQQYIHTLRQPSPAVIVLSNGFCIIHGRVTNCVKTCMSLCFVFLVFTLVLVVFMSFNRDSISCFFDSPLAFFFRLYRFFMLQALLVRRYVSCWYWA